MVSTIVSIPGSRNKCIRSGVNSPLKMDFKNKKPFEIFVAYIVREKELFIIDTICAVLVAAIDLAFPYVSKNSMQTYLPQSMYKTFFIVMAILAAAYVLKAALYYVITVLGHRMGVNIESRMREDLYSHMQALSFGFYDKNRTGTLVSRLTGDLFEITELAHHGPENIIICALTIVGSMLIMFTINWQLTLVLAVLLPLCLWFTLKCRVKMKDANMEVKRKMGVIYSALENGVSGVRTAKAFANEELEKQKFDAANDMYRGAKKEYYKTMGAFMSGMEFTTGIMPVVVIAVGGVLIMNGRFSYIDLITFTLYVSTFINPVRKLAQFAEIYMQGAAGFERFLEIMRTEPEIVDAPDAVDIGRIRGDIALNDVSFTYDSAEVLHHVSLRAEAGKTLALIGPSGGGKTTISQLIMRFYDVSDGSVTVDGTDVRGITQASLRRNIGIIQQDVYMFAGTVRENIRYGRPDATDAEVIAAAKAARADAFIRTLPGGYQMELNEDATNVSQGQKQLLTIARAVLANAPILILDEATSSVDTRTEQLIQEAMDHLMRGRTSFVIAHRLSTIRNADCILVMRGGSIVEQGTHAELLARGGFYAALYNSQFEDVVA